MISHLRTLALRLLGSRRLSPFGAEIQALSFDAGIRTRANWLVPGLAALGLVAMLAVGRLAVSNLDGFTRVFLRIFAIDLGIFVAAWLSGWNAARRWRMNRDLLEEVTLTPLRPLQFFHAAATGPLGAWTGAIGALLVADVALCALQPVDTGMSLGATPSRAVTSFWHPLAMALLVPVLCLSHLESVRLSHVLFVEAAIPSVGLRRMAFDNLFKIAGLVLSLSVLGCAATGLLAAVPYYAFSLTRHENPAVEESVWALCSVPALLLVIAAKRETAVHVLRDFARDMLLYRWYGAAESELQEHYPDAWVAHAQLHSSRFELEDALAAPEFPAKKLARLQKRHDLIAQHMAKSILETAK